MLRSWMIAGLALFVVASGFGQAWRTSYESGLKAAREARWLEAREAFKAAAAARPDDQAGPTSLPGPVTEQRRWRDGAPYSPNFLAAYSAYRQGLASSSSQEQASLLRTSAAEFEALLAKGQYSRPTFYFLRSIYTRLADTPARQKVEATYVQVANKANFRVDLEAVTPEDQAQINQTFQETETNPVIRPGQQGETVKPDPAGNPPIIAPPMGAVPIVENKYALIIANTDSAISGNSVPFAAEDANVLKEALTTGAGYPEPNVSVISNATAAQMQDAANALAAKIGDGATVFIYFGGVGSHLDGKDYLAGVNTAAATDSSTMLAKFELFKPFITKGAQIFAFFETNRPVMSGGSYFGMEAPLIGAVSQVYATLRGESVYSMVREGKQIGIFADSMAGVMYELKSNRIPIVEYAWQLFYRMRRGSTGGTGGGSGRQTPTLPIRSNMASDARF
jgi:hypothetical protein